MSSVKLQGNASGTGSITLFSPNTNNNQTVTLPDATTTMVGTDATQTLTNKTLTTPTIAAIRSAASATPTVFQDSAGTEIGTLCRAWVNFNGTTSPGTINGSFNVSSVTKNTTGDYTVNFTTAMPDANFSGVVTAGGSTHMTFRGAQVYTTTSFRWAMGSTTNNTDATTANTAIFR